MRAIECGNFMVNGMTSTGKPLSTPGVRSGKQGNRHRHDPEVLYNGMKKNLRNELGVLPGVVHYNRGYLQAVQRTSLNNRPYAGSATVGPTPVPHDRTSLLSVNAIWWRVSRLRATCDCRNGVFRVALVLMVSLSSFSTPLPRSTQQAMPGTQGPVNI